MKSIHALVALVIATLFTASFTFAGHGEAHGHHEQVTVIVNGEKIDLSSEELEEGDTRQFFTDSGKEVLLTREADGLKLTVDGEDIHLGGLGSHGKGHVMVKRFGAGDHSFTFDHDGDHEDVSVFFGESHEWIHADGDAKVFFLKDHKSPAEHLVDSGVLDQVDEAAAEAILEVLREIEPRHQMRRLILEKAGEGDEVEE